MDKLNLDGLSEWAPYNAVIARELLFSCNDICALEPDELGCTSAIKHEICLNDDEPFKESFRRIPPPLLEEVQASLRDMLEAGTIWPSQSPWCNAVVLVWKKNGSLQFCIDFRWLNMQRKIRTPPQDTRSTGEHGQSCTLLHHGFQEWILASPHGPRVTTIYHIHSWQPWFLWIHQDALWTL